MITESGIGVPCGNKAHGSERGGKRLDGNDRHRKRDLDSETAFFDVPRAYLAIVELDGSIGDGEP